MKIAQNFGGHLSIYCYDDNKIFIDNNIEWVVNASWYGSPYFNSITNNLKLDYRTIKDSWKATVLCSVKNHPNGWQEVQGTVNGLGVCEFV